jgi:hypothetical protein
VFWTCGLECDYPCILQQGVGIEHLHLPTVDFLFAPDVNDMERAVAFIHGEDADTRDRILISMLHLKSFQSRVSLWVLTYLSLMAPQTMYQPVSGRMCTVKLDVEGVQQLWSAIWYVTRV